MPGILWRIILAVICLVLFFMLLPPLIQILGIPLGGPVLQVIKICAAGIAIFYIIKGPYPA